jgi:hypothetical protein
MNIEKWLYLRRADTLAADDGDFASSGDNPTSICIPSSRIKSIHPSSDTSVRIQYHNVIKRDIPAGYLNQINYDGTDFADVTITAGKAFEVMATISAAIASDRGESFIIVADDVTSEYIDGNIVNCGTIQSKPEESGLGIHEYIEMVTPASSIADDDVMAELSIKLPHSCIILEAALTSYALAGTANGKCALAYHSAAIADGAAGDGVATLYIGADASGNTSIPDANLDFGSGGVLNDTVHSGTAAPVDRDTAETHFQLVQQTSDSVGDISAARIIVYVKWWGGPAVAI